LLKASIFRKECCDDKCDRCTVFADSCGSMLQCPLAFNDETVFHWKEYTEHTLHNGKPITELKNVSGSVNAFKEKFVKTLVKYKQHYFRYRWLNLCRKLDFTRLGKFDIFIQTDYSAQPVLDSQDKLNSVGHGVCVLSCWVVLHSPRRMRYVNKNGVRVAYTYYSCDHIRVVTPSTGKQKDQDWFFHCKVFEYLLSHYKREIAHLKHVILWPDGAPNQYKCRQNFYWVANVFERFGISVVHRFGATAHFKGVHDKIGQTAKWIEK
jgi:hypothetical protein